MSKHHIDDLTLNAYLDGELSPEEAQAVDDAMAYDATLQTRVESLAAVSGLSRAAVSELAREPVPDQITRTVQAGMQKQTSAGVRWQVLRPTLAAVASLVIGVMIGIRLSGVHPASNDGMAPRDWHGQVAWFHDAAAERLARGKGWDIDHDNSPQLAGRLSETVHYPIAIPELSAMNLTVAGARILHSNKRPFPQIYFVNNNHRLVSLAIKEETGPALEPYWNRSHATPILAWRRNTRAYALASDEDAGQLEKISAQILSQRPEYTPD